MRSRSVLRRLAIMSGEDPGVLFVPCPRFRPGDLDDVCFCGWLEEDHDRE